MNRGDGEVKTRARPKRLLDRCEENQENIPPNAAMDRADTGKKTRFKTPALSESGQGQQGANETGNGKPKSGLPRFVAKAPKVIVEKKQIGSGTCPTPIPDRTNEKLSTPGTRSRPQKSRTPAITTEEQRLKEFMDSIPSTVCEERINEIMGTLKTKNKWELKDRCKLYEVAVKDMREAFVALFTERTNVKSSFSVFHSTIVRDLQQDQKDVASELEKAKNGESRLRKDLLRSQESSKSDREKASAEQADLRSKLQDSDSRANEIQQQLEKQKLEYDHVQKSLQRSEEQLQVVKAEGAEQCKLYMAQCDQVNQHCKEEISAMRIELDRRHSITEKSQGEKLELDRRAAELREELMGAQARAREAEHGNDRNKADIQRLTTELQQARDQCTQKDTDLRTTLLSITELHKQASEEKGELKCEMSALQGKLQVLERERLESTAELAARREDKLACGRELQSLRDNVSALEAKLLTKDAELAAAKDCATQLEIEKEFRSHFEMREAAERVERIAALSQLHATEVECNNRLRELEGNMARSADMARQVAEELSSQRDHAAGEAVRQAELCVGFQSEIAQLKQACNNAMPNQDSLEQLGKLTGELEIMRMRMREATEQKLNDHSASSHKIQELEERIRQEEILRRKLHNVIQELRGNVRVFARVRPFLPSDGVGDYATLPEPSINTRSDGSSMKIIKPTIGDDRAEEFSFSFDRVFGMSSSQESVFQEVSEFVQSALDGYNVCLFSYGQTGSGKTHTMQGSGTGSMRGIMPRAMEQVGLYKLELESKGWKYQMDVSFIEIYNENIKDLLRNSSTEMKHEIKRDSAGNTVVTDVTMITVDPNDTAHIDSIMELAAKHRSVGQTAMNQQSSRSHSIFSLHLVATHAAQGIVLKGTLNLVDLAGSERLDRSGATGSQLKETVAINKSLSALTDVFVAIGNKQSHVPFRNSKLTYLLQPALSGDGKTLMLANLSPTAESYFESLCSLRFASQVNQCELGKPKRQMKDLQYTDAAASAPPSAAATPVAATSSAALSRTPSGQAKSVNKVISSLPPRKTIKK